jgi:alkanesulfonate monooxygenase SsuD/methylene tetrahydromethanopterin reductase-like flavin-dependent oxidoreductase (luciferase family)
VRVGLYLDLRNPPPWRQPWGEHYARVLERIARAEELGIDAVWLTEHHFFEDGYLPQPLTFAAAIAARTERMRIGTAIMIAGLRPAVDVAEQAAIVDILSGGRLELGLGAGYRVPEFAAFGASIDQRYQLLEQRAAEIQRLWGPGGVTPRPLQDPPPIWIGGRGPRAARIAGRLGAGLMWLGSELLEPYVGALREAGHAAGSARLAGCANLILADDPEEAWTRIKPHLAYQWSTYARYGSEGVERAGSGAVAAVSEDVDVESLRSPGPVMSAPYFDVVSAPEAISRLRAWLAPLPAGDVFFWDAIAGMPDELTERHIELLATEVAPALADLPIAELPATGGGEQANAETGGAGL